MEKSKNIFKKGAIISYTAIIIEIIAGLLYVPWMISMLGSSNYAIYSLAISLISILSVDFGLTAAAGKFIAKCRAEGDIEKSNQYSSIIIKLLLFIDCFIFIASIVIYFLIGTIYSSKFTSEEIEKLKVVFIICGLYSVISFPTMPFGGFISGNNKFYLSKFISLCVRLTTVISIVIFLILGAGLYEFVLINCTVSLLGRIAEFICIKKCKMFGSKISIKFWNKQMFQEIFKYTFWTALCIVAEKLIVYSVPSILGAISGTSEIAIFQVGLTIDTYIVTFSTALDGMFIARLSEMDKNNFTPKDFTDYWIKVARFQVIILGLFIVGFISLGKGFVNLWMGTKDELNYGDSYYIAILLIAPGALTSTQQVANTTLIIKDKIKYKSVAYLIACVLCVGLTFLLVSLNPKNGPIFAALSVFIGRTFGLFTICCFVYKKCLKLEVFRFLKSVYFKFLIVAIAVCLLGFGIDILLPSSRWLILILKACLVGLLYATGIYFVYLNSFEKSFIKQFLRRKKGK